MFQQLQNEYDKQFGFNDFPYTHGDDVEKAQEEATKKWRSELVDELQQKGAIQSTMADSSIASARKRNIEDELEDKAKDLAEAR